MGAAAAGARAPSWQTRLGEQIRATSSRYSQVRAELAAARRDLGANREAYEKDL